ncbi:hypothetical protein HZA33_00520 [Candidatus Pacearchaeota archaeon]|nr:hypothetical protein [Candidatus Pacearchaeota archaeon]
MKELLVAFITQKLKQEFESLKEGRFEDKKLYGYIKRAIDDLKKTPLSGIKIPKNLWPKEYIRHYKIKKTSAYHTLKSMVCNGHSFLGC